jgi:Fe-S-cluster containining protein
MNMNKKLVFLKKPTKAIQEEPHTLAYRIAKAALGKRHLASWLASVVAWDIYLDVTFPLEIRARHPVLRLMRAYKHKQCLGKDAELCQAMIRFGYEGECAQYRTRPENCGHTPAYRRGAMFRFKPVDFSKLNQGEA